MQSNADQLVVARDLHRRDGHNNAAKPCGIPVASLSAAPPRVPANQLPTAATSSRTARWRRANTGTIGGYLKIDMQDAAGTWRDVTMEILNYGIRRAEPGGRDLRRSDAECDHQAPASARLRNPAWCHHSDPSSTCTSSYDYWPNTLYDPREGLHARRRAGGAQRERRRILGGVMHYVALDVGNLSLWFQGRGAVRRGQRASGVQQQRIRACISRTAGTTGPTAPTARR